MSEDELMRALAELVGRALARRWLERSDRPPPQKPPAETRTTETSQATREDPREAYRD